MPKKTQNKNTPDALAELSPPSSRGASNLFLDDEGTDHSVEALEVLMSAQERMKGIIECASALNQLMAEAADKDNMPFPVPLLPPGLLKSMQAASSATSEMRRATVAAAASEPVRSQNAGPTSEPFLRLEGLIQSRGFITNEDVREVLSLTPIQATFRLKQWVADRHVVQRGQRRGARYVAGPRWPPRA